MNNITDTIFIEGLQLYASIGTDCWARPRPQLVLITLKVDLPTGFIDEPGESDDVQTTLNYSSLATALTLHIEQQSTFESTKQLALALASVAFDLAGQSAVQVRMTLVLPKLVLLATRFSVDTTATRDASSGTVSIGPCKVSISNIVIPAIIGIHPHEIATKQRVILDLSFLEHVDPSDPADYRAIVSTLAKTIESTAHLTLESFVFSTVRTACLASTSFETVTVRTQKPSALTYARASGVEITRKRSAFL